MQYIDFMMILHFICSIYLIFINRNKITCISYLCTLMINYLIRKRFFHGAATVALLPDDGIQDDNISSSL